MDLKEANFRNRRHPWEIARLHIVMSLMRKHTNTERPLIMLDIGCGDAFVAASLCDRFPGLSAVCIDENFSEREIGEVRRRNAAKKMSFFNSLEEAFELLPASVDLVLLLDVLEHVESDRELLKSLSAKPYISDHTIMIITVPAFQSLFSAHDIFLGHFRRYSASLLRDTLTFSDFSVNRYGFIFFSLLIPRWIKKKMEKPGDSHPSSSALMNWQGGRYATSFLSALLRLDFFICNNLQTITGLRVPGLSVYAICQKQH
jgi:hypothetical protein